MSRCGLKASHLDGWGHFRDHDCHRNPGGFHTVSVVSIGGWALRVYLGAIS